MINDYKKTKLLLLIDHLTAGYQNFCILESEEKSLPAAHARLTAFNGL